MSLQERISSMVNKKIEEQSQTDFISDSNQEQKVKNCTNKLLRLIVKLQESKSRSKKEYPVQIRERIFLGNYVFASDKDFLTKSNIGLVISCLGTAPIKIYEHIRYEKINIKDQESDDLIQYSERVYETIESHLQQNSTGIYIHCFKGVSRSPAVLLMYLMKKERKNFNTLVSQMKSLYSLAEPNSGFIKQLQQYEKTIDTTLSTQNTDRAEQDDLLGFEIKPVQTNSTNLISTEHEDLLSSNTQTTSQPDHRQHLLIPEHEMNASPKKAAEYHLIQIDQDDQNADLI